MGLAIARRFVASGARVLLVDVNPVVSSRPREIDSSGIGAFGLVKDLTENDAARVILQTAVENMGHVDALINNAAWSLHKPILEMTFADFDRIVAVNQRAPFFLAQEFTRYVSKAPQKPRDPVVISIASVNALAGNANLVAYAGTKGALVAMTRAMAVEMAPLGIRVNCISPSTIDTPAARKVIAEGRLSAEDLFDKFLVKRFITPEEVAGLVAYLCGTGAGCVTGANWIIDGGYLAQ